MTFRILIAIILFVCGAHSVSAGVITSADNFEFQTSTNSMSVPDHSDHDVVGLHAGNGFGMSKAIISNSTFTTAAVVEYSEFNFNVLPTKVGSRWRLANQTLPVSPYSCCLLKPS